VQLLVVQHVLSHKVLYLPAGRDSGVDARQNRPRNPDDGGGVLLGGLSIIGVAGKQLKCSYLHTLLLWGGGGRGGSQIQVQYTEQKVNAEVR
jgi:hypothetical protein